MSKVYLEDSTLTNIGNAIRGKTGESGLLLPSEMANAITNIPTGGGSSELVFKMATITPSGSATTVDISPWITDDNINDWFMCGGFGAYMSVESKNNYVMNEVIGPIFRNVTAYDWTKYAVVPKAGSNSILGETSANTGFGITDNTTWTGRIPLWNPTTKILNFQNRYCLGKKPIYLYYREV